MIHYWPILIAILLTGLIVGAMWILGAWLGPKNRTAVKLEPFECGETPFETPGRPVAVKFYLIAILFVIFDIDLAYLFPWAVVFRDIGVTAFCSMVVFIGILSYALWYIWRKGALTWR